MALGPRGRRQIDPETLCGGLLLSAIVLAVLLGPLLLDQDPIALGGAQTVLQPPGTPPHFLGTDALGRDLLARLLHGGRWSLMIATVALALGLLLGLSIGAVAALGGGWVDSATMRLAEVLLSAPKLLVGLTVGALLGTGPAQLVGVLALTGWMEIARLTRAELKRLGSEEFILAARALGAGRLRLFLRHLLPNAMPVVVTDSSQRLGELILAETALSFLGVGLPPPTPTWGSLLADALHSFPDAWWLVVLPGLALMTTVLATTLLADGLGRRREPTTPPPQASAG